MPFSTVDTVCIRAGLSPKKDLKIVSPTYYLTKGCL